jgi:hypothetical protein
MSLSFIALVKAKEIELFGSLEALGDGVDAKVSRKD